MEPVRVLNFVGRMDRGGIENFIMNVYRNIDRSRVQFDFVCHYGFEGEYNEEIRSMGGKIYEMPPLKVNGRVRYERAAAYVRALRIFFGEHKEYAIIHGHMTNTAAIYMPIAKKYGGARVCIAHSHSAGRRGLIGAATKLLQLPLGSIADCRFACSEAAALWMFPKNVVKNGGVKILHNGIIPEDFAFSPEKSAAVKRKLGIEGRLAVGNAGGFKPEKNQAFTIEAFGELKKLRPDAVLLLAGEGRQAEKIAAKADRAGLSDSVIFTGTVKNVGSLMQALDVYLMPSLSEGLPMAAVEAQAAGLPLIISDSVTRETDITGSCAFLPLSAPTRLWAEEIVRAAERPRNTNAPQIIKEKGYDIRSTAKRLEEFYLAKAGEAR